MYNFVLENITEEAIMAIAIRPIPVLTGSTAERFEEFIQDNKKKAKTYIPQGVRDSVRSMQKRSQNVTLKMPNR